MRQHNRFREDMLDLEEPEAAGDVVYIAAAATSARVEGDVAILAFPLVARKPSSFEADPSVGAADRRAPPAELRRLHGKGNPGAWRGWDGCAAARPGLKPHD